MTECTNSTHIKESAQFFEANKELLKIFVSSDGQFFYTLNSTSFHCITTGATIKVVTREMYGNSKIKEKEVFTPKHEPAHHKKHVKNGRTKI